VRYLLVTQKTSQGPVTGITCLDCGFTSYHPQDVIHRYCPRCRVFHDDVEWQHEVDAVLKKNKRRDT
jgi:hypothetical protein